MDGFLRGHRFNCVNMVYLIHPFDMENQSAKYNLTFDCLHYLDVRDSGYSWRYKYKF